MVVYDSSYDVGSTETRAGALDEHITPSMLLLILVYQMRARNRFTLVQFATNRLQVGEVELAAGYVGVRPESLNCQLFFLAVC